MAETFTLDDAFEHIKAERENLDWDLNKLKEEANNLRKFKVLMAKREPTTEEYVAVAKSLCKSPGGFFLWRELRDYDPTKPICYNCGNDHGATEFDCEMCSNFDPKPEFYRTLGKLVFKPE